MARLHDVVVDCAHPASLARFWAQALDGYRVAAYDDAELERLRAMAVGDPEDDPSVLVEPISGGPRLFFQLVPESKRGKNRLHLDLVAGELEGEAARLVELGARILARRTEGARRWIVLSDPEGNELCLLAAS